MLRLTLGSSEMLFCSIYIKCYCLSCPLKTVGARVFSHSMHSLHSTRPGRYSDVIVAFDGAAMAPPLGRKYERFFKQGRTDCVF